MANELTVWLFDDPVGTLSLASGRLGFHYLPDWLNQPHAKALSQSLPLQSAGFDDHRCRPFFAGLLPEGHLRALIAKQYQISEKNDFALINAIGGECAGAITFLPSGESPQIGSRNNIEWLDDHQLIDLLKELPRKPMLAGRDGIRLSLAGAQDKLPVVFDGFRIGLPKDNQPSTHVLKPPIESVESSVINEAFCLRLAKMMLMDAASATICQAGNQSVLLVARYDRKTSGLEQYQRIHQEDFCQALGITPEMKYQNEGGPDLKTCFNLIRKATRPSATQIPKLLNAVVFNALIGNHDAHAKNFSLLYSASGNGEAPTLAPLYDLFSTAVYENLTSKMAMKLGGKYQFSEVQARHWESFAKDAGLPLALTKKRVLQIATELPNAAKRLQTAPEFDGQLTIKKIVNLIDERSALTIKRLTHSESTSVKPERFSLS